MIDTCDLDDGPLEDCKPLVVRLLCEADDGASVDLDLDGIRDECDCAGDANGDLIVNLADILFVLNQYGPCAGCLGDLNDDDQVNFSYMTLVLANWGIDCRP